MCSRQPPELTGWLEADKGGQAAIPTRIGVVVGRERRKYKSRQFNSLTIKFAAVLVLAIIKRLRTEGDSRESKGL